MTSNEAVKLTCPFRLKNVVTENAPGGRSIAKHTYATCLGNKCSLWRLARPGESVRLCGGSGSLDECMAAHKITSCEQCLDREGFCAAEGRSV